MLHLPGGPGPHPIAVLLHGFPGNERNFDLAPVVAAYAAALPRLEHHLLPTDHSLADHRVALARAVAAFLAGG